MKLRPIRTRARIANAYAAGLQDAVRKMTADYKEHLIPAYGTLAHDSLEDVDRILRELGEKWQRRFEAYAVPLQEYIVQASAGDVDRQLRAAFQKKGMTVRLTWNRRIADVTRAAINENVALIRSIPVQYHQRVETAVYEAVRAGSDLHTLYTTLEKSYDITQDRAKLIARDQHSKIVSDTTRERLKSAGITQAIWRHSHAGKEPRQSHVEADGKKYDVDKGMYLDGEWTFPGREINCRCYCVPVVPWTVDGEKESRG